MVYSKNNLFRVTLSIKFTSIGFLSKFTAFCLIKTQKILYMSKDFHISFI